MRYPTKLRKPPTTLRQQTRFGGLDRTLSCPETGFSHMENLTSDHFPYLSPRSPREESSGFENATALIAKDALCWVQGSSFYINGYGIDMGLSAGEKQLVGMGAWVVIFPDKKRIHTVSHAWEDLEAHFEATTTVTFTPCTLTGDTHAVHTGTQPPTDTTLWWLDTAASPAQLKLYNSGAETWVAMATPYTKLHCAGIGKAFRQYDGVALDGLPAALSDLQGYCPILDLGEDHLIVQGLCPDRYTQTGGLTVRRTLPDMDFVIESKNRLWGCKYGLVGGVPVNEIYASKLGDPTNWHCFMGISTDSQVISCGSDGPWTGAATLDAPLFFKENHLHRVYGSGYPFGVTDTPCHGVQRRCHKSLAVVGDALFYKSPAGVMVYDGSLPLCVSEVLGALPCEAAAGGSLGNKYYLSLSGGSPQLLVYDRSRDLWHREDGLQAACFCALDSKLYALAEGKLITLAGGTGSETVTWSATTGRLCATDAAQKYLTRLTLRLQMAAGARLRLLVRYDSTGGWEQAAYLLGQRSRSFSLAIRCRRCDHLQLRLEGQGDCKLLSLSKTLEQGSEISCS